MKTIAMLLRDLSQQEETFDLATAALWMRYAYASGYLGALCDPAPNMKKARQVECEGWARLP